MAIANLLKRVKAREARPYPVLAIPAVRVFESTPSPIDTFAPRTSYLEVRLAQLHLRNRGEWWREFVPLASVVTEIQYQGKRLSLPFISGPDQLQDRLQGADGAVDIYYERVAGPLPYMGDDVGIFAALCRTVRVDWAERAFELIESVAKQFDVTRVSSMVSVAGPLVDGLESLLGMDKTQLRIAVERQLVAGSPPGSAAALEPGWIALFSQGAAFAASEICVVNNRLCTWDGSGPQVHDYLDSDFMLLHVRALEQRDDYESFAFHQVHWPKVQDRLWDYQLDAASAAFEAFVASLMQCEDLVREQRKNLLVSYQQWFAEDLEQSRSVHDGTGRLDSTIRRREIGEAALAKAATSAPLRVSRDLELRMDAFAG